MNEANLWDWLRDVALPLGQYSRIESPDTAPGFPDVFFQVHDAQDPQHVPHIGCGTLELKATDRSLRVPFPDEEKGLHKTQLRWIRDNVNEGGIVWIIAETPGVIYIVHGKDAAKFNGATHEKLIDMAWETMSRSDPKQAARLLDIALRVPSNYRLFAEYYGE
jgi:hypothetical protein